MRLQILLSSSSVSQWMSFTQLTSFLLEKEETVPNEDGEGNGPILVTISGKEWELIRYTVDGLGANCNSGDQSRGVAYLGIQRRKVSNRLDHIRQVSIVLPSSPSLPQGPSPEPSD
jgi:hypothetical protein